MSARSKIVRDFSGQEVAIPYDPRDDAPKPETPGALQAVGGVIREHLPSGETIIIATDVGNYASFVTAAELVRRWNGPRGHAGGSTGDAQARSQGVNG